MYNWKKVDQYSEIGNAVFINHVHRREQDTRAAGTLTRLAAQTGFVFIITSSGAEQSNAWRRVE